MHVPIVWYVVLRAIDQRQGSLKSTADGGAKSRGFGALWGASEFNPSFCKSGSWTRPFDTHRRAALRGPGEALSLKGRVSPPLCQPIFETWTSRREALVERQGRGSVCVCAMLMGVTEARKACASAVQENLICLSKTYLHEVQKWRNISWINPILWSLKRVWETNWHRCLSDHLPWVHAP